MNHSPIPLGNTNSNLNYNKEHNYTALQIERSTVCISKQAMAKKKKDNVFAKKNKFNIMVLLKNTIEANGSVCMCNFFYLHRWWLLSKSLTLCFSTGHLMCNLLCSCSSINQCLWNWHGLSFTWPLWKWLIRKPDN